MEQSVQVPVPKGPGEPADILFLRIGGDIDIVLPGRDPRDAEVLHRGAPAAEGRGHEPPRRPDADAHEAVPSPEELLHCRVSDISSSFRHRDHPCC